jgi:hypothetical protein
MTSAFDLAGIMEKASISVSMSPIPAGGDWKIDLWGWPPERYRTKLAEHRELGEALERIDRSMLLRLKMLANRHPSFRDALTTHMLYRAALAHPERSAEQLLEHVEAELAGSAA